MLAFFNEKFLSDQILKEYVGGLKENGLLVINTTKSWKEIMATFPDQVQSLIKYRRIKLVTLDGTKAALKHLNRNLPGTAILGLINQETGILPEREFEQRVRKILEKKLGTKKKEMLEANISLLKFGVDQSSGRKPEKAPGLFGPGCHHAGLHPAAAGKLRPEARGLGPAGGPDGKG